MDPPYFLKGMECNGDIHLTSDPLNPNHVLISCAHKMCFHYDLEESRSLTSWFASSYLTLSAPILRCRNGNFVALVNEDRVLEWNGHESRLDQIVPVFQSSQSSVLKNVLIQNDSEVYILFADGSLQTLDYLKKHPEFKIAMNSERRLLKASLLTLENKSLCILIDSVEAQKDIRVSLYHVVEDDEHSTILRPLDSYFIAESWKCFEVLLSSNTVELLFCSSEGFIQSLFIYPEFHRRNVISLPEDLDMDHKVSFSSINSDHIGILGRRKKGDGNCIILINTKYSLPLSTLNLKIGASGELQCFKNSFFVKHGLRIAVIRVKDLPESMASLVGLHFREHSSDAALVHKEKTNESPLDFVVEESPNTALYDTLPALIQNSQLIEIQSIVRSHGADLPELFILSILEVYIKSKNTFSSQFEFEKSLNEILRIPFTESIMHQYLRNSELAFAISLLQHLHLVLQIDPFQNFNFCTQWLSLLLKAHYINIQLSQGNEVKHLLTEILETIHTIEMSENFLSSIIPLFTLIRNKVSLEGNSEQKMSSSYMIEIVDL